MDSLLIKRVRRENINGKRRIVIETKNGGINFNSVSDMREYIRNPRSKSVLRDALDRYFIY